MAQHVGRDVAHVLGQHIGPAAQEGQRAVQAAKDLLLALAA